jgi:hypothetical protein
MKGAADDQLIGDDFPNVADQFVRSRGPGALRRLLQNALGTPGVIQQFHRAVATLAKQERLHIIITTNYDDLLERALSDAKVPHIVQTLERNFDAADPTTIRVLKVHGSRDDWSKVIFSGESYKQWGRMHALLNKQLDVLCLQYPLTFVGSSLCEPRILGWLAKRTLTERASMLPWRAFLTKDEWKRLLAYEDQGVRASEVLIGQFRPVLLDSHEQISTLWSAVTNDIAEEVEPAIESVKVPLFQFDWPQCSPDPAELEALLAEAQYRARAGLKPYCQVALRSLESARAEEVSLAGKSALTPDERLRRVHLLETIKVLEQMKENIQSSMVLLLDDVTRRETGWGIVQNMSLVVEALLGNDSKRGPMHAWVANNEDQISSWVYFSREELVAIVGHELSDRSDTYLSIDDFPLPKAVMDLEWSIQDRCLGIILHTLIRGGRDPLRELRKLRKEKWCLFGD